MPDHDEVYESQAGEYERLISREDYQNMIPQTLTKICNFEEADIIDLGAGTGRLTYLFAPAAQSMLAFDLSEHMLKVTASKLRSVEEAEELTGFFFGGELADEVRSERVTIVPECIGIWWLKA